MWSRLSSNNPKPNPLELGTFNLPSGMLGKAKGPNPGDLTPIPLKGTNGTAPKNGPLPGNSSGPLMLTLG